MQKATFATATCNTARQTGSRTITRYHRI